ncbi:MAG: hypothetical protein HY287_11385 [Planctomycetes bacterium]|nr:hypothetical protein [Planctomycetota bacterium]MBI3834922.1 hypothetical protein [Planctomycetota bacterium]
MCTIVQKVALGFFLVAGVCGCGQTAGVGPRVVQGQPELNRVAEGGAESTTRRGIPIIPPMNRYLAFTFGPDGAYAIRVTLVSLMHPSPPNLPAFPAPDFSAYEGQVRWLGPVMDCRASEVPPATFKCALLQCEPYYTDWYAQVGSEYLYITGSAVIPSSSYDLQGVAVSCLGHEDTCTDVSQVQRLDTFRWGDVAPTFQDPNASPPPTQPNITDVASVVDRFKGLQPGAPVWLADMNPQTPDFKVNISDVASTVDAFKGMAYPFQIDDCP